MNGKLEVKRIREFLDERQGRIGVARFEARDRGLFRAHFFSKLLLRNSLANALIKDRRDEFELKLKIVVCFLELGIFHHLRLVTLPRYECSLLLFHTSNITDTLYGAQVFKTLRCRLYVASGEFLALFR